MLTVAYLANLFPAAVEPYVEEEIRELRRRGVRVIPGSIRKPDSAQLQAGNASAGATIICLERARPLMFLRGLWLLVRGWRRIADLLARVLLHGKESPSRRFRALLHTWLGAYYAARLQGRGVNHIHVHHGYFGAWMAMVAARLLGISFSLTLHGSDLLVDATYLDIKLKNCLFCVTISEYNRRYIHKKFPDIAPGKIIVSRLGVEVSSQRQLQTNAGSRSRLSLLAVGRLHSVKDHAFLICACARLRDYGLDFECTIAGDGPERKRLEWLVRKNHLQDRLSLAGHLNRQALNLLYAGADVVVLTSRSEGIPLVLMEAMARGKIVLAPGITGIPELVIHGKTGFLYAPGVLDDFVSKILMLRDQMRSGDRAGLHRLHWIRHAACVQVLQNFDRRKNLTYFADQVLQRIATHYLSLASSQLQVSTTQVSATQTSGHENWITSHENLVLQ